MAGSLCALMFWVMASPVICLREERWGRELDMSGLLAHAVFWTVGKAIVFKCCSFDNDDDCCFDNFLTYVASLIVFNFSFS